MSHYLVVTDLLSVDPSTQSINITCDMYEVGNPTNYITAIPFNLLLTNLATPNIMQVTYRQQLAETMATNLPTNNFDITSTVSFLGLDFSAAYDYPPKILNKI